MTVLCRSAALTGDLTRQPETIRSL